MNIALIPARGGSVSIPLKNIQPFCGRPLIFWTIDAALGCSSLHQIAVSTDSEKIRELVESHYGRKVCVLPRSVESATDTASTEIVLLEFAAQHPCDAIVLIQATSPLLTSEDLDAGFALYQKPDIDSVLSGVRQKRFIWSVDAAGRAHPQNYDPQNRPRRQEFTGFLVENGAFYITSRDRLISSQTRVSGNIGFVEMDEVTHFEIDEPADWAIMEQLMRRRQAAAGPLAHLAHPVRMFLTDCDGVLTDGGMYYSETGDEMKKFCTQDGLGLSLLRESGVLVGIISGEDNQLLRRRAQKLHIEELHMGIRDKSAVVQALLKKYGFRREELAYLGDDVNDLTAIQMAGFGCCVANAAAQVKDAAAYVTQKSGGAGAVREAAEIILTHNTRWENQKTTHLERGKP